MSTTLTTDFIKAQELMVKMAITAWEQQNDRVNKLLSKVSDEQLATDVASNRNSGTYLLGHLVAVSDGMLPLLDLGEKLYPDYQQLFLSSGDKKGHTFPSIAELKKAWEAVNAKLTTRFYELTVEEWLEPHTAVSPEDFAKEPHRNKLNVLLNRTNHQAYHLGQLIFLVPQAAD